MTLHMVVRLQAMCPSVKSGRDTSGRQDKLPCGVSHPAYKAVIAEPSNCFNACTYSASAWRPLSVMH
jgi:hypothetical protein